MEKSVSAIIITKNRLSLLELAVKSVIEQTYRNLELIIVDDGSDDGTWEWCQKLIGKAGLPILYIHIPQNESRGGNHARNLGIKKAKGEFVAFLDDDDRWLPNKIEAQVKLIEEKGCDLVYGGRYFEYVEGDKVRLSSPIPMNPSLQGDVSRKILTKIITTTSLILVRKSIFDKIGMFDENLKFWQEYDLSIRIAQVSPFYYVDEPLIIYRVDKNDNQRLTNKYFVWRESVDYIHRKYKNLYRALRFSERMESRELVWGDASVRCRNAGLTVRRIYYSGLCVLWNACKFFSNHFL